MTTAYSYVRFSTEKQEHGASLSRQIEQAKKYAESHKLTLSEQTYQDLGVSAYRGLNAAEGALSRFLEACRVGKVQKGSYLLVESLDRLSRANVQTALGLFQTIVGEGITIVTLSDGQLYSTESLNENWTKFVVALAVMSRANEESKLKSKRIQDGWNKKKEKAASGSEKLTSNGPSWMVLNGNEWKLLPVKVDAVRKVFELAMQGHGTPNIARLLNEKYKVQPLEKAKFWTSGNVRSVLTSRSVIGTFQRRTKPEEMIENYYPSIIDTDIFYAVQEKIINRRRKSGIRGEIVNNLFSGLLYCPCGSKMRSVNSNKKYFYIRCVKSYAKAGCDAPIVVYKNFERSFVNQLITLLGVPLGATETESSNPAAEIIEKIQLKKKAIQNITKALEDDDYSGRPPTSLITRIANLEDEISTLEVSLKKSFVKTPFSATKDEIINLLIDNGLTQINGSKEDVYSMRLKMASQLQRILTKIIIRTDLEEVEYQTGFAPDHVVMFAKYQIYGQIVDELKSVENNYLGTSEQKKFDLTDDGGLQLTYPVRLKSESIPATKRRASHKSIIKL